MDEIICFDSNFNDKFEFKGNEVNLFKIENTNYHKIVDCHGTNFKEFKIRKSIFNDFVGFEECIFGVEKDSSINNIARFIYTTFLTFVNFRNAKFLSGLDLERINLKEPPNFLNVNITPSFTNRETFRIIKHSFDNVGNYIEANRFYEYEMGKYKKELELKNDRSGELLLKLYGLLSKYGQSFGRPLLWILCTSIIYCLLLLEFESNTLYSLYPSFFDKFQFIEKIFNGIAKGILPFTKVLKEGMEFLSLIFYVFFTILIWLTILAIKRKTRR